MNKTLLKIGFGLLALTGMILPSRGAVTGMKTLTGHVPQVVSQLTSAGRLSATNELHLSIGLPLRNRDVLTNLLREICDPASPNYKHYLASDEFTAQFGPTTNDYQAVLDFAAANGLKVTHTHPNRMLVSVVGKVSDVERAFNVQMNTYHHPKESRDFYAPSFEPSVDASLPIMAVQGMNNYVLPHPMLHKSPISGSQKAIGTAPLGGYMGQDFRNAYVPGSSLNGAGQTVGLLQFDGYFPNDIQQYETIAGLPNVPLQNVLLDGFNGLPGFNNDEVCLDIETTISMAPGLSSVVLFEGGPFGNADDILNAMASNSQIKQLSASWAYGTDATSEQIYQQFILQGQTYLNASGDGDAWVGPIPWGSLEDPYVTLVGGTTLFTSNGLTATNGSSNGSSVSYFSEQAWNWGFVSDFNFNPDGYAGTSGGVSTDVGIPYWQQWINMTTNLGSTTFRNSPDVALTADNVFVVSSGGQLGIFGGTSCASPLWAGFMALVNQQAAINGAQPIGFLAPAVYALAKTQNYTNCFHDITAGDNTWPQSTNKFFAVPGYDLCTGLGTPNGTNFINTIVPIAPIIPAPPQPWGTNLSVMDGADPNGFWFLYYRNENPAAAGTNYYGWAVNLTTANPVGYAADNELTASTATNGQSYSSATNIAVAAGSLWQTLLAVTNYGPSLSSNVFVTDILPLGPGVTNVSYSSSIPNASITIFGNQLTWNIGNLPVNAGGTLALNIQVNNTGVYTDTATVKANTTDPNPDDASVAVTANVATSIPPSLVPKMVGGGNGEFHLSVTNNSGSTTVIQASTNLVAWLPVYTNVSPFTFTNFDVTNFSKRFYRAVQ